MSDAADVSESLFDERLEIETPERVKIVYDLAGIGSRFAAGTLDVCVLFFIYLVLSIVIVVAFGLTLPKSDEAKMAFGMAFGGALVAVLSGYFVLFEWFWAGQTPGKRILRLRVLSDGGGPATPGAIFLRNILRVVDLAPFVAPYGLGGVAMFLNRRSKRIGDYAAGTIVVREREQTLAPPPRSIEVADADDALPAADLARIREFFGRAPAMIDGSRRALARRMADDLSARLAIPYVDAEQFLRVLASGRPPRDLRDAQGPQA
jgi:uncharacterized RDD family membrane protein YckC